LSTLTPALTSASWNSAAVERAGSREVPQPTQPRSAISADSGAHSSMKNEAFQPGAVRVAS
jgi:hypothetical protein